jgi:transcription-repair coupling factor (superfamily II helicase)
VSPDALVSIGQFAQIAAHGTSTIHVSGALGTGPVLAAHTLAQHLRVPLLYLTHDASSAKSAASDFEFLQRHCPLHASGQCPETLAAAPVLSLHGGETSPYLNQLADQRSAQERLATLFHLAQQRPWQTLVMPASALVQRLVPPEAIQGLTLATGRQIDSAQIIQQIADLGYLRTPLVEDPGTFAVRGSLLDAWPAGLPAPVRVELFGDEIISIKRFDANSQRTHHSIQQVDLPQARWVPPSIDRKKARERLVDLCEQVALASSKTRTFVEERLNDGLALGQTAFLPAFYELTPLTRYLPPNTLVAIEDPGSWRAATRSAVQNAINNEPDSQLPHFPPQQLILDEQEVFEALSQHRVLCLHRSAVISSSASSDLTQWELAPTDTATLETRDHTELARSLAEQRRLRGKQGGLDPLIERLLEFLEQGLRVCISAHTATQAKRLLTLLEHRGVPTRAASELSESVERTGDSREPAVEIVVSELGRGTIAPLSGFVLMTEEEIFGARSRHNSAPTKAARNALEDLRALKVGDLVVHVEHGIGRYLGMERRRVTDQASVELLVIEYASNDRLLLPVYRLNQLQKYLSGDGSPKLDRLGGATFAKTKARVQKRVREMADELLRLYADRAHVMKAPLAPVDDDYAAFEAQFPFEETVDQALAIQDVLQDLEQPRAMDRLICGDVGFGKTEVALRAAFRHAMAGKQVALLCPTTVLAQQHFLTFSQRFQQTPLKLGVLSRFQSKAEQRATVEQIRTGQVDVVIGTHRLLSHDIHFKNLGLLVVDEEQRFGVSHKERIKQLRTTVDVLTLTATPIPRTLQLAVGGLRDMSVIQTPPEDRRAIRTLVVSHDESTIRDAIHRELQRGGQVYYVYNRVQSIYERAERLKAIVPEARIAVAHGQMSEAALEQVMLSFVQGEYDVLVCTAIVESGLDIPRANTMLIDRAELFGLAQLHQLRGRVGRSPLRAYCYLLVPPPSSLSAEARTRVEALAQYSELGSGIRLATLDMELRGAGNLLGAEQSGTVDSVGLQLFCQMLADATQELKGIEVVHEIDPDLSFDVEALLPETYIEDIGLRLSLYKRLASADDEAEVVALATEMEERFGAPPSEAQRLIELMRLKIELRRLRVLSCEASRRGVTLHLKDDTPLDRSKLQQLLSQPNSPYRVTADRRLSRRRSETDLAKNSIDLAEQMVSELSTRC